MKNSNNGMRIDMINALTIHHPEKVKQSCLEYNLEDFKKYGFFEVQSGTDTGYYFLTKDFRARRVSNFFMPGGKRGKPTDFFARLKSQKRRFEYIPIPDNPEDFTQKYFEERCANEGDFWFIGTNKQFQLIKHKLYEEFK